MQGNRRVLYVASAQHAPTPAAQVVADVTAPAAGEREQLRGLTALRFLAAAIIVVLHTRGAFGFPADWGGLFQFSQAVPFFFILSGFILTYVYQDLDEAGTRRYLVARWARLWPAHAATLLLTVLLFWLQLYPLLPGDTVPAALANLVMVHAWVPYADSYFSFNSPSWSISNELAFYLLFPLLIWNWKQTWHVKLALAFAIRAGMELLADSLNLPPFQLLQPGLDLPGLLSVSPLTNLHLFVLGMTSFLAWQALVPKLHLNTATATLLELATLGFTAWALATPLSVWGAVTQVVSGLSPAITIVRWVDVSLTIVAFVVLIVVMALGQGLISRVLTFAPFVLLGEISYAIYLMHVPVKIAFFSVDPYLASIPDPAVWAIFWLIVLVAAWGLWWFVERPARRLIRSWYLKHEHTRSDGQWRVVGTVVACVMLLIFALHILTLR